MLTDAMLRDLAAEAEGLFLAALPLEDGEPHVFSERFKKKMKKLMRRVDHPIRYHTLRAVAALFIVIATLFGALMAFSPDARAAVVGWVKSAFHEFFEYSNESPQTDTSANKQTTYEYRLAVNSDEYRELNVTERTDGKRYTFADGSNNILRFAYAYDGNMNGLFIKAEDYSQQPVLVNGLHADVYIALNDTETNVIVWQDPETNTLLYISAFANQDMLLELAESVIKIEK